MDPKEGWYPDPEDNSKVRWWDGYTWSKHTQPNPNHAGGNVAAGAVSPTPEPAAQAEPTPQKQSLWRRIVGQ